MLDWIDDQLHATPLLALFICISVGYVVGRVRFWKIQLGGVCGTLLVALVVGQSEVELNAQVKDIAFALFIFSLGYVGGPQFFASLNRRGLRYGTFPLIEVVSVLAIVSVAIMILDLDRGTAAGLLAGGATESAAVGTATDAIGKLDLPPGEIDTLQANVATAYTISYLCGLITIVLLTSQIAPLIMRIDLRAEATRLWERLGGKADPDQGEALALPGLVGRAHEVTVADGRTVAGVERALGADAAVERIGRGDTDVPVTPDVALRRGDAVLLVGERSALIRARDAIGPELAAGPGSDMALDTREVVFNRKEYAGRPLGELRERLSASERHGVFLTGITRVENPVPMRAGTVLENGDVLQITGAKEDVERVAGTIGYPIDPGVKADFVYIGLGLIVGIMLGKLTLDLGEVPVSLGTGGGALLAGLVFGWLRAKHPTFGAFHPAAASVIKDFGLVTFIAAVGLASGPQAIDLIEKYGAELPIAGILVTLIPASISLTVGWKLMKIDAPILLGAVAGQQCSTPAITAIQQVAGNSTPLIGYTIVYALSNVVLPLLGPIIVAVAGGLD